VPRDYKNQLTSRRRRSRIPPWVWLLAGVSIGLIAALGVFRGSDAFREEPSGEIVSLPALDAGTQKQPDPAPQPDTGAHEESAPPRPRFDFYNILPELEVVVPEKEITGKPHEGVPQVERPGTYLLQAGSFRSFQQADRLKAELVLLGLQTDVQNVTINNRETWYRVRVGPYHNLDDLNEVRSRLRKQGIDAILIKIRGQG
jgi:cell division protein FtsN